MIVKVLSTHHSGSGMHLEGSTREVFDSIGKELIQAGIAEEFDKEKEEALFISKKEVEASAKKQIELDEKEKLGDTKHVEKNKK